MRDGTADTMHVAFPATDQFSRIGRVAIAGLALRLGIDIAKVEDLRSAVDETVAALRGDGQISIDATWEPGSLVVKFGTSGDSIPPVEATRLQEALSTVVDDVVITGDTVELHLID